ncbi:Stress-induced protein SAM22 [Bienertia sinuspersici]
MDKFKSIKFVNLYTHSKQGFGAVPKGAEWKVKWVKNPNGGFTGKCHLHSIYKKNSWPAPDDQSSAIQWSLNVKQLSFEGQEIEAQLVIEYDQGSYFLTGPKYMMSNYERFASPRVEPLIYACKWRPHNWQKQKQKQKEESQKQSSVTTTTASNDTDKSNEVGFVRAAVSYNGQVSQQLAGWQVGQVVLNYTLLELEVVFLVIIPDKMLMAPAHKIMAMST